MGKNLLKKLPLRLRRLFEFARKESSENGWRVYLVGGIVRDLILGMESTDIDVVVEGDGIGLARRIAERFRAGILVHNRFLTATVRFLDGLEVDFSTARKETYSHPAALPDVEQGSISDDLKRRDFSINAIALSLNKKDYADILDPFNGMGDMRSKIIRVLHERSFMDDPTRAFRAVRYMTRFGFNMEGRTASLLSLAKRSNVFTRLTAARIYNEIKLLLSEARPAQCMVLLKKFGLLSCFSPEIELGRNMCRTLDRISEISQEFNGIEQWKVGLLTLLSEIPEPERGEILRRYPVESVISKGLLLLDDFHDALKVVSRERLKDSKLFLLLEKFPDELIVYGMAFSASGKTAGILRRFLRELKTIRAALNGNDLKRLGIPEGPAYSKLLRALLLLRLDGRVRSKKEAERWVLKSSSKFF